MNILILDKSPISLAFALRCQGAGHRVKLFQSPREKYPNVGRGLVPKVETWQPHMNWADLVFMSDNSYMREELEVYFRKGFPIFGCNTTAAEWELNRGAGQEIFRRAGLPEMESHTFHSYREAISFIKGRPKRYVSKPNGDMAKDLSYVSKGPADMVYMLERWQSQGKKQDEFILQDFHAGIEMGVGGWFGPDGWSKVLCENWEFKKLCNDDIGVATGEMGTVLRYVEESRLADETLFKLTNFLHAIGYVGYCDVNCIIAEDGTPYPLEFTNRPGWPLFNIQQELHLGDPAQWMVDKLEGRDTLRCREAVAVGVVMCLPDFPYSSFTAKAVEGVPVYGLTKGNSPHIHLSGCMAGRAPVLEGGEIVTRDMPVSASDYLLVASGRGDGVEAGREAAYAVVKGLEIPNSVIYRTDIGCRLEGQLPKLQALGYATGMEY